MGTGCSDSVTLNLGFTGNSAVRTWDIKVSQIPCNSNYSPPDGCLQYHTELDGRFTTFNFIPTNQNHLLNQQYSICIRPAAGFCCVQYQVCGDANSMSLDAQTAMAQQDDLCSEDYVGIPGSSDTCNQSGNVGAVVNRYCGQFLNTVINANNIAICDCTAPFTVDIVTNALPDQGAGIDNANPSRGTCLEYTQVPCAN